jgi:N utilization substance protein B
MGKRRQARELALKVLFQVDVGKCPVQEALEVSCSVAPYEQETVTFARELVEGAFASCAHLDSVISRYAEQWSLERMANVDRNILRLATYEILFRPDIPPGVSIDEAVDLAKKYSTEQSGKFVNGILGSLIRDLEAGRVQRTEPAPGG